jgi:aromatic ring-opening dioxygenase catalytic subunit (LigB family)
MAAAALPTVFINHGGGPCFFMPDDGSGPFPANTWRKMASNLSQLAKLPGPNAPKVKAILVASAHWETEAPAVTVAANPPLLYDYYGFPPETYEIEWPAPGDPDLAQRVKRLLTGAGFPCLEERDRGLDHGVFIPLKLAFPAADVPVVQLSLVQGLDPKTHLAMGKALAPLRREGVLIIGSGMSFHNLRAFFGADEKSVAAAESFDAWLDATCGEDGDASAREPRLERWATDAPNARVCHPREEHLAPLFVAAGAASGERGRKTYADKIGGLAVSGYAFGDVDDERLLVSRAS